MKIHTKTILLLFLHLTLIQSLYIIINYIKVTCHRVNLLGLNLVMIRCIVLLPLDFLLVILIVFFSISRRNQFLFVERFQVYRQNHTRVSWVWSKSLPPQYVQLLHLIVYEDQFLGLQELPQDLGQFHEPDLFQHQSFSWQPQH